MQHSNEFYRNIKHPGRRVQSHVNNALFTKQLILLLSLIIFTSWLIHLILLCGDIESNPGPNSVESLTDTTLSSLDSLSNHLSIMHLNIQSLVPKLDLVEGGSLAYDILVFSESWLKPEVRDDSILIEFFLQPFRTDRCHRPGGGVAVYVRDTLTCRRRPDLEIRGLEAVWVEIKTKSKKVLILLRGTYGFNQCFCGSVHYTDICNAYTGNVIIFTFHYKKEFLIYILLEKEGTISYKSPKKHFYVLKVSHIP